MARRRKRRIKLASSWVCCLVGAGQLVSVILAALVLMGSVLSCGAEMSPALLRHLHHRHQHQQQVNSSPVVGNLCALVPLHVAKHLKLCRAMQSSYEAAEAVKNGTANGLVECRRLFQDQRWNCTHSQGDHQLLTGDFGQTLGLRESSFVQAITAAALVHSIASACSLGSLKDCSCDRSRVGTIKHHEEKWKWGGCSHNIRQGMQFAKFHVDLLESVHQYQSQERRHRSTAHLNSAQARHFRHNLLPLPVASEPTTTASQHLHQCPPPHQNLSRASHMKLIGSLLAPDSLERHQLLRLAVNMHNNRVGRMAVANNMELKCRCHGLSGSCSMKTCWLALPDFQQVGAYLKRKYDAALHLPAAVDLNRLIPMMDRDELSSVLSEELRTAPQNQPINSRQADVSLGGGFVHELASAQVHWRASSSAGDWTTLQDEGFGGGEPAQVVAPMPHQQYLSLLKELKLCSATGATDPTATSNIHHLQKTPVGHLTRRMESGSQQQLLPAYNQLANHQIKSANQHLAQVLAHSRNKDDLIYLHKSPDFCQPHTKLGFAGLSGRLCSRNGTAHDNCDKLCCSSGYSLRAIHYPYTCDCKFQYCCSILCKQCEETAEFHVCN